MSVPTDFAGALWMNPGRPCPTSLHSTRPEVVARVTRGLEGPRVAPLLGSLFSLCGHAHAVCATLALRAAAGEEPHIGAVDAEQHARHTLNEHLRCICFDWPRIFGDAPTSGADDAARWFRRQLAMPPAEWLANWTARPHEGLSRWCDGAPTALARWMRQQRGGASFALPDVPPLRMHAQRDALRAWAAQLRRGGAAFARQPLWHNACAETGVWTRLSIAERDALQTPWLRLGARIAEATRLMLGRAPGFASGALALGRGEGLGWIETSRGLLTHCVQLDPRDRVATYHVVAPTDWNAHPRGGMAQALARIVRDDPRLPAIVAAYDPCVPCRVAQGSAVREQAHA